MSDAPAYAESLYPRARARLGAAPRVADGGFKLIEAPQPELYDLEADPTETTNRSASSRRGRRSCAAASRRRCASGPPAARPRVVDPTTWSACGRSATSAARGAARRATAALRDPKDGIRLLPRLNRGMSAARADPELAIRELTSVLAEDPGLLMARRTRAVAYAAAGRHDLAIADLRQLEKDGELTAEDAIVLGDNLRSRRDARRGGGGPRARGAREPEVPAAAAVAGRGAHPERKYADAGALSSACWSSSPITSRRCAAGRPRAAARRHRRPPASRYAASSSSTRPTCRR